VFQLCILFRCIQLHYVLSLSKNRCPESAGSAVVSRTSVMHATISLTHSRSLQRKLILCVSVPV